MKKKFFAGIMVAAALMAGPFMGAPLYAQEIAAPARDAGFFRAADDLPLMPGLQELPDEAVIFDQPDGRVVEVVALAPEGISEAVIRGFYRETLPQLGWEREKDGSFYREAEILTLEVVPEKTGRIVRLAVAPR